MDKRSILQRIHDAKAQAILGGGQRRIDIQHGKGKLTARERIDLLLDEGSFVEYDMLAESAGSTFGLDDKNNKYPGDGVVTGRGHINGRPVFFYSQDFTVLGGSLAIAHGKKILKVMDNALKIGCPFIAMNDSGGARIQEGIEGLSTYASISQRVVWASGVIPQLSLTMGPCAGGAVYVPAMMDWKMMVKETSQMFVTGPNVIKTVTGEDITIEELGGWKMHACRSGSAHFACENDIDIIMNARRCIDFLPLSNMDPAPIVQCDDPWDRDVPCLDHIIPSDAMAPYDVKFIIRAIVDNEDFFEVHENFAKNLVVGLGRMDGRTVAFIANQPNQQAGCVSVDASKKGTRFIRFIDAFNIPLIFLVDIPGFLPGVGQESSGIIARGAAFLFAQVEATIPKISIIMRKAYGGGYASMGAKNMLTDMNYAWPSGMTAVMGTQGAAAIVFKNSEDLAADEARYEYEFMNPFPGLKTGLLDDVIEPRSTRRRIISDLRCLATKELKLPYKKHSNINF